MYKFLCQCVFSESGFFFLSLPGISFAGNFRAVCVLLPGCPDLKCLQPMLDMLVAIKRGLVLISGKQTAAIVCVVFPGGIEKSRRPCICVSRPVGKDGGRI